MFARERHEGWVVFGNEDRNALDGLKDLVELIVTNDLFVNN
jgi:hypothetical protein